MLILAVIVAALAVLLLLFKLLAKGGAEDGRPQANQAAAAAAAPARGMNRMQAGMRRRRARVAAAEADGSGEEEEEAAAEQAVPVAATHARREAYDAKRAKRDTEREAQEAAQEAEIARAAQDAAQREEESAAKWMHTFTLEAAGEEALSAAEGADLSSRLVEYIAARKAVGLDEVAAEFGLKVKQAVQAVQALEEEGRITGVMDDRGKFIFISRQEMEAVAAFIRRRGRIAIGELAARSDEFIDLSVRAVPGAEGAELDLGLPAAA